MQGLLIDTTALAALALLGYVVGRRTRSQAPAIGKSTGDGIDQTQRVAIDVQRIVDRVRRQLASHQGRLAAFRHCVEELRDPAAADALPHATGPVDDILHSTAELTVSLAGAYDELRSRTSELSAACGGRLDGETGAYNRLAMLHRLHSLLDIDPEQKEDSLSVGAFALTSHDDVADEDLESHMARVTRILHSCARDTDFVARCGKDEFAVLMPQTPLTGAGTFCDRVLRRVGSELGLPIWCGIAAAAPDETGESLLSRADAALYTARTQPAACLFKHDGGTIRRYAAGTATTVAMSLAATETQQVPMPVGADG